LHDGQRGACFVRQREGEGIVLTTYGRSSGFCVDPIEKKPLNHFHPGSAVLSFGTAGCNLACKFCQNWDISKSREMDTLMDAASPEAIAAAAAAHGCRSVAFTYNDPVIFAEYALDTADACHARGVATVAVTAGYIGAGARAEFFGKMDAANVDLKAFTDDFYVKLCGARLGPVLDTLVAIRHGTACWLEITTLLIPGKNDSDAELTALCRWVRRELGPDVPLHFTAPPRLQGHRRRRDSGGHAHPGAPDRPRRGVAPRLHRQRPRPRGRHHLLRRLPRVADRARRLCDPPLRPDAGGRVPALRHRAARAFRHGRRAAGGAADAGAPGRVFLTGGGATRACAR
jgi:pyruvate-formate lyase-activating enzyme